MTRDNVFTNEGGRGGGGGRGFLRTRGMDVEVVGSDGGADGSCCGVAVGRGGVGDGEEVIYIEKVCEGGGNRVEDGMHDCVGDSWDVVPTKGGAFEGKVAGGVGVVTDREDELCGEGGGKDEGPVEVGNVSVVEKEGCTWAKKGFECGEVGELESGRKERLSEVGWTSIKDGTEFWGVGFRFDKDGTGWREVGGGDGIEREEVRDHGKEGWGVGGGTRRGRFFTCAWP